MDGENVTNPGGAAVATPVGAQGGESPAPQAGAGAPTPVSPSGASVGASEQRTYRDEDVQRIVRERLADEQKKWKEAEAAMVVVGGILDSEAAVISTAAEQLEKAVP